MAKGQLSRITCPGTLEYHSLSRLSFRCFSSPTSIPTHCS